MVSSSTSKPSYIACITFTTPHGRCDPLIPSSHLHLFCSYFCYLSLFLRLANWLRRPLRSSSLSPGTRNYHGITAHFGLDLFADLALSTSTYPTHPFMTARSLPCLPLHINLGALPFHYPLPSPPPPPPPYIPHLQCHVAPFCHTHDSGIATPSYRVNVLVSR